MRRIHSFRKRSKRSKEEREKKGRKFEISFSEKSVVKRGPESGNSVDSEALQTRRTSKLSLKCKRRGQAKFYSYNENKAIEQLGENCSRLPENTLKVRGNFKDEPKRIKFRDLVASANFHTRCLAISISITLSYRSSKRAGNGSKVTEGNFFSHFQAIG